MSEEKEIREGRKEERSLPTENRPVPITYWVEGVVEPDRGRIHEGRKGKGKEGKIEETAG